MNEQIPIRMLQHFLYCRHRWGLMEIDRAWAENAFVVKANLMHERVHSPDRYSLRGKKVYTEVSVWNDFYGIYGKLDCLEETAAGFTIVEYKPTKPKDRAFREDDAMQVFAQKVCVDDVFHCDCKAVIYYGDCKERVELPLQAEWEAYNAKLTRILTEMRNMTEEGIIPEIPETANCNGCSMKDLCMPSTQKKRRKPLRRRIAEALEEES